MTKDTQIKQLTHDLQPHISTLVWDYNVSAAEFAQAILGYSDSSWFGQEWAVQRSIERLPYYTLIKTIPLDVIATHWPNVRTKVFNKELQSAYDFVLQRYALSTTR